MNTITYTMTKDYRKEWDVIDAVRELVQNCLDNKENPSAYSISTDGMITIHTPNYELPMSAFALGESLKEADSIGGFGEGFKLALLILAREELEPYVMFGTKLATPYFAYNTSIGRELFTIGIEDNANADEIINNNGLTFIFNFPYDRIDELKQKVDVFSDNPMPLPNTIDILEHRPGEVFVNGLFVCKKAQFRYGYNFAPACLKLGCDRQTVDDFGVSWATSQAWCNKVDRFNKLDVLSMLTEQAADVKFFDDHCTDYQAKMITEAFVERYGNVTIKSLGSSLGYGMSVGGNLYNTMRKSGYTKVTNTWEEDGTPYKILQAFLANEKGKMRRVARTELETIIERSKKWSKE